MRAWPIILTGGGIAGVVSALVLRRKMNATVEEVKQAVSEGGTFKIHATGYWPFSARPDERKMEGAPVDRKGRPLHTVEDFLAGKSDHASVSGDDAIFPYGQKILVQWFDTDLPCRVTDTGGHFRGLGKVYRVGGEEPCDFCVASSKTPIPKSPLVATIVVGDHWDKAGKEVAADGFKGQTVSLGGSGLLTLGYRA